MTGREVDRLERALHVYWDWHDAGRATPPSDLLQHHAELSEYLEPMVASHETETDDPPRLGDFVLHREIGRGGMGVVYEATQASLQRRVALKVLPIAPILKPAARDRFEREAKLAARLEHPGIARILAVGTDTHRHFFAMDLVPGAPLSELMRQLPPGPVSAMRGADVGATVARLVGAADPEGELWAGSWLHALADLVAQMALALHHAHEAGILHRDVKPSNVLIRADGRAVLVDFGLAREVGPTSVTLSGGFAGTPLYVSPEQARGDGDAIDRRSDVFSLGAMLYELVTRRPPFAGGSSLEVLNRIQAADPVDPRRSDRALPRDIIAIGLKALEKNPARRYQSAADMAADLQRFATGRAVTARPPSVLRGSHRWLGRNRDKLVGTALALTGILAAAVFAGRALDARDAAERSAYRTAIAAANAALRDRNPTDAVRHLDAAPPERRGWEWHYLRSQLESWTARLDAPAPLRGGLCLAPDATTVYSALDDGSVGVGSLEQAAFVGRLRVDADLVTVAPELSGRRLAVGAADGRVFAIDVDGRAAVGEWRGHRARVQCLAWAPDGTLFSADRHEVRRVRSGGASERVVSLADAPEVVRDLAIGPGGRFLVVATRDARVQRTQRVHVIDLRTGKARAHQPELGVLAVALHPSGDRIAMASPYGEIVVLDRAAAGEPSIWEGHRNEVVGLRYSGQGDALASVSRDGTVQIRDVASRAVRFAAPHLQPGAALALSRDGRTLAAVDADRRAVVVWEQAAMPAEVLGGHTSFVHHVCWSGDGAWLATATVHGSPSRAHVFDAVTGAELARLPNWGPQLFDGEAERLFLRPGHVVDLMSGARAQLGTDGGGSDASRWSLLSRFLAVSDATAGRLDHYSSLSPDGRLAVSVHYYGSEQAVIATLPSGETLGRLVAAEVLRCVAFSRDGRLIATGSVDGLVRLWDARTRAPIGRCMQHPDTVFSIDFSPDGQRIATGCLDNTVRIFDAERYELLLELHGHSSFVRAVAFSPDGTRLASASGDRTVRIWDRVSRHERAARLRNSARVVAEVVPIIDELTAELGDRARVAERVRAMWPPRDERRRAAVRILSGR